MAKTTSHVSRKKQTRRKRRTRSTLYKQLPQAMKILLKGRTYETGTGTSPPIYYQYGILEFLNRGGSFTDTMFTLYKWAVIQHCKITVRLVNLGTEPLLAAIAPLPYDWPAGSPTMSELIDCPRSTKKTTGGNQGSDKTILTRAISSREVLGKAYQIARYQMNAAQAASTTPIFPNEPSWIVGISSFNSSTAISYRMEVEFEWHVDFYNLDSI